MRLNSLSRLGHSGTWISWASLTCFNADSPCLFTLSSNGLLSSLCVVATHCLPFLSRRCILRRCSLRDQRHKTAQNENAKPPYRFDPHTLSAAVYDVLPKMKEPSLGQRDLIYASSGDLVGATILSSLSRWSIT